MNKHFNKKPEYGLDVDGIIGNIMNSARVYNIPYFISMCVADTKDGTEYKNFALLAQTVGYRLYQDKLMEYVKITRGFETDKADKSYWEGKYQRRRGDSNTVFLNRAVFEAEVLPHVKNLLSACRSLQIPLFMSFAVSNQTTEKGHTTDYLVWFYSPEQAGVTLQNDYLSKMAEIATEGKRAVPEWEIPNVDDSLFDGLEDVV